MLFFNTDSNFKEISQVLVKCSIHRHLFKTEQLTVTNLILMFWRIIFLCNLITAVPH